MNAARTLHAKTLASLGAEPLFEWSGSHGGILITSSAVTLHKEDAGSLRAIPIGDIRRVSLRRGWWATMLEHHLTIEYSDGGEVSTETVSLPRQHGEEAALRIADASAPHRLPRFEVEPILNARLIAGLLLSWLFMFALGSLRFYFRGDGSFVEIMQVTAMIAGVITIVVAMIAFWQ